MASTEGGVDIEEVAEHNPEKIIKEWVDPIPGHTTLPGKESGFPTRSRRQCFKKKWSSLSWPCMRPMTLLMPSQFEIKPGIKKPQMTKDFWQ